MFTRILTVMFSWLVAFSGLFTADFTDRMPEEHEFPIINYEEQQEGNVRVMSFNLRCKDVNGTSAAKRRLIVAEEILETAPDSLGVQEATPEWMRSLKMNLFGYRAVGVGRDGGSQGEFSAVFYNRKKWKLLDSGTFWLSETPEKVSKDWDSDCRRICTWVILQNKETGEKYAHVNSHFDHRSSLARENGAKLVISFIEEKLSGIPVVFTADMNCSPNSNPYNKMTDGLCDARLSAKNVESYGTFHGANPDTHKDSIIDYVLCSPGIDILKYRTVTAGINGRFVSDHFPIYADFLLPEKVAE